MDQSTQQAGIRAPLRSAFGYQPTAYGEQPDGVNPPHNLEGNTPEAIVVPAIATPEPVLQPTVEQPTAEQPQAVPPQPAAGQPPQQEEQPQEQTPPTGYPMQYEEELLYDWEAPSRPFKKRKRQYFMTVITIGILLSLILFFAGQLLPIAVVFAVVFLAYVMAVVPPHTIKFMFTTYGVRIEDQLYYWEELGRFWFTDIHGQRVVHVEVDRFPFKLSMVLGEQGDEAIVTEIMSVVLYHEQPKPTLYEQIANWLQKKFPLDLDS